MGGGLFSDVLSGKKKSDRRPSNSRHAHADSQQLHMSSMNRRGSRRVSGLLSTSLGNLELGVESDSSIDGGSGHNHNNYSSTTSAVNAPDYEELKKEGFSLDDIRDDSAQFQEADKDSDSDEGGESTDAEKARLRQERRSSASRRLSKDRVAEQRKSLTSAEEALKPPSSPTKDVPAKAGSADPTEATEKITSQTLVQGPKPDTSQAPVDTKLDEPRAAASAAIAGVVPSDPTKTTPGGNEFANKPVGGVVALPASHHHRTDRRRAGSWDAATQRKHQSVHTAANPLDVIFHRKRRQAKLTGRSGTEAPFNSAANAFFQYEFVPSHTGNNRMGVLINLHMEQYQQALLANSSQRCEKICLDLIRTVAENWEGRFLFECENTSKTKDGSRASDDSVGYLLLTEADAVNALQCIFEETTKAPGQAVEPASQLPSFDASAWEPEPFHQAAPKANTSSKDTTGYVSSSASVTSATDMSTTSAMSNTSSIRSSRTRSSFTTSNSILNAFSPEERKDIHKSAIASLKQRKKRADVSSKISNLVRGATGAAAAAAAGVGNTQSGLKGNNAQQGGNTILGTGRMQSRVTPLNSTTLNPHSVTNPVINQNFQQVQQQQNFSQQHSQPIPTGFNNTLQQPVQQSLQNQGFNTQMNNQQQLQAQAMTGGANEMVNINPRRRSSHASPQLNNANVQTVQFQMQQQLLQHQMQQQQQQQQQQQIPMSNQVLAPDQIQSQGNFNLGPTSTPQIQNNQFGFSGSSSLPVMSQQQQQAHAQLGGEQQFGGIMGNSQWTEPRHLPPLAENNPISRTTSENLSSGRMYTLQQQQQMSLGAPTNNSGGERRRHSSIMSTTDMRLSRRSTANTAQLSDFSQGMIQEMLLNLDVPIGGEHDFPTDDAFDPVPLREN